MMVLKTKEALRLWLQIPHQPPSPRPWVADYMRPLGARPPVGSSASSQPRSTL